ncbi:thioredoxin fold domain-containing protein [Malaciobacter mytili]|uniref:thioredoxin fold domain-containing protein n=1 Tax=Malaciobacter mytili TaxID=603050 RepID=UPI003BAE73B6
MLNIIKKSFLIFLFIGSLFAQEAKEVSKEELSTISKLELIQKANIQVKKAFDYGSIYILATVIQGAPQELFLTKDKKVLLAGNAMNANTGEPFTIPADLSKVVGKEALIYGSGKDEYILFTDPECPYCKQFESYFPQIEKNVKIRVFFYPLSFHENAKDLSLYYMSKKTNEEKINAMLNVTATSKEFIQRKIDEKTLANLEQSLEEQMVIAEELNVRGTPTLYNIKGKKISWVELLYKNGIKVK